MSILSPAGTFESRDEESNLIAAGLRSGMNDKEIQDLILSRRTQIGAVMPTTPSPASSPSIAEKPTSSRLGRRYNKQCKATPDIASLAEWASILSFSLAEMKKIVGILKPLKNEKYDRASIVEIIGGLEEFNRRVMENGYAEFKPGRFRGSASTKKMEEEIDRAEHAVQNIDWSSFPGTDAKPGTYEKVSALAERARQGKPLWHIDDFIYMDADTGAVVRSGDTLFHREERDRRLNKENKKRN